MPPLKVTMSWCAVSPQAKRNVKDVLNSGWLSRRKYIPLFEQKVAQKHHAKHGILMSSGTDALRISLLTLKEIYKWQNGDRVIIPGLTFVATANAVLQSGLAPVFADVQMKTGNIEPEAIAKQITPSTRAVIAVHLFGLPANMPAVMQIAKAHRLRIVEDSCETFGVHRLAGDMACFSFFQSHHIQTGVGGMMIANNRDYERVARSYMNHGRTDDGSHFEFGRIGYSARSTELEAAIGVANLNDFERNLAMRRRLADYYTSEFYGWSLGRFQYPAWSEEHSWMFYPILLLKPRQRDNLLIHLRKHGIESREAMPLVNQPCYRDLYKKGSCPVSELWAENGLLLPLHPLMQHQDIRCISLTLKKFFN